MSRKQRSLLFPILRHTKKTIDVSLSLLDLRRLKKKKNYLLHEVAFFTQCLDMQSLSSDLPKRKIEKWFHIKNTSIILKRRLFEKE